jgi:hypothetical protein
LQIIAGAIKSAIALVEANILATNIFLVQAKAADPETLHEEAVELFTH